MAEGERGTKFARREVAFAAELFAAGGVEDDEGRGPSHAEALEPGGIFLDVGLDGNELAVDVVGGRGVGVILGFQPSASGSMRGGAEVEQDGSRGLPRLGEGGVHIGAIPID